MVLRNRSIGKQKNKFILLTVLFLIIGLFLLYSFKVHEDNLNANVSSNQGAFEINQTSDGEFYKNNIVGLTIDTPANYLIDAYQGPAQKDFFYFAVQHNSAPVVAERKFRDDEISVSISMSKTEKRDLNEFMSIYKDFGSGFKITSKDVIRIDGKDALRVKSHQDSFGGVDNESIYILHNGYEISINKAPAVTSLQGEYDKMIASIKLI